MSSFVDVNGNLDGGYSWLVVLGSFLTQFVVMGVHNVFGLLYIDLLEEFGESNAATGIVILYLDSLTWFILRGTRFF